MGLVYGCVEFYSLVAAKEKTPTLTPIVLSLMVCGATKPADT